MSVQTDEQANDWARTADTIDNLVRAIDCVAALHKRMVVWGRDVCVHDDWDWPCPTSVALNRPGDWEPCGRGPCAANDGHDGPCV